MCAQLCAPVCSCVRACVQLCITCCMCICVCFCVMCLCLCVPVHSMCLYICNYVFTWAPLCVCLHPCTMQNQRGPGSQVAGTMYCARPPLRGSGAALHPTISLAGGALWGPTWPRLCPGLVLSSHTWHNLGDLGGHVSMSLKTQDLRLPEA